MITEANLTMYNELIKKISNMPNFANIGSACMPGTKTRICYGTNSAFL